MSANTGLLVRTSGTDPAAVTAAVTPGSSGLGHRTVLQVDDDEVGPVDARTPPVTAPGSVRHKPWHGCPVRADSGQPAPGHGPRGRRPLA